MGRIIAFAGALLCLIGACVDVEEGEQALYGSPCSGPWRTLLRCDLETGGADPEATGSSDTTVPFTCAEACQQLAQCGFGFDPSDDCVAECEDSVTQAQLDCLRDHGCDIAACFSEGP